MNDLGFNLCVVLWSPVVMLVVYFRVERSHQRRGPKEVKQEPRVDRDVKDHVEQEWNNPEQSRVTLEWKGVDNESGEQPWPQLVRCASICCHVCGCIFQED